MQIKKPLEFDTWFGSGLLFFAVQKEIVSEINKKSEPISNLENLVRIICVWCGRWDLNPYVIQHTPLKRACLPIPALPHIHFVHQRCNVYIIRNPAGFVNPFFEKSFLRAAGAGCGGCRTPATFNRPCFFPSRCRRRAAPRRAPAAAAAARVRRAAPRFPKSKAIR
mgnify:CR=1 FL=1